MANVVKLNPEYFPNPDRGRPVNLGDVYVGKPDLDPEVVANQKQVSVQQEDGSIVNVSQPVSLSAGGVPTYNGSPVTLLVDGDYSLKVLNSQGSQVYYVPSDLSLTETVLSSWGCDIAAAITAIGATETTLIVDCIATIADGVTVTIPDTMTLQFVRGGLIQGTAGGGTETLDFDPGAGWIFDPSSQCIGSNLSLSGSPSVDYVTPDLWGAIPDGSTDSTTAIQAMVTAVESMDNHPPMKFLVSGNYYLVSSPINITGDHPVVFLGDNYLRSQIRAVNATPFSGGIFNFVNATVHKYIVFKDLWINGNADAGYGIYGEYNAGSSGVHHIVIEHCRIQGTTTYGIFLEYGWDIDLIRNIVTENTGGGIYLNESANMVNLIGNKVFSNSGIGIVLSSGNAAFVSGNTIETNAKGGIQTKAFRSPSIIANYFEKNGTNTVDENYACWLGGSAADSPGGVFIGNKITGNNVDSTGIAGLKIDYALDTVITGNLFRHLNYGYDQSNQIVVTRPTGLLIDNNTYESTVTTIWNPHATFEERLALNGNRIFIPGVFERSGGNLIKEHPVMWTRTVSGASTCNIVAGEYPSFTITKAVGETAYVTLTLDFSKEYSYLRGKYITFGVTTKSASSASLRLYLGALTDTQTIDTTVQDHKIAYKVGAAETTLIFRIRVDTDAVALTFYDFWITAGLDKPSQSINDIPIKNSFTWDPGNLVDGAGETKSTTVYGAEFGDLVQISAPYDLQDMIVTGYVQAADTVEARLQNESGGAVDLASGTWNVKITKP